MDKNNLSPSKGCISFWLRFLAGNLFQFLVLCIIISVFQSQGLNASTDSLLQNIYVNLFIYLGLYIGMLFVFLFATAAGTLVGGPLGDRIGRKWVILLSIAGTAPFSLALPYAGLTATVILSFCSGFVLSSAFPAFLIYAQELLPNRLGLVSGLFFGFAFGIGGIISAILGAQIDIHGIESVYRVISLSPLIGLVAVFLPKLGK